MKGKVPSLMSLHCSIIPRFLKHSSVSSVGPTSATKTQHAHWSIGSILETFTTQMLCYSSIWTTFRWISNFPLPRLVVLKQLSTVKVLTNSDNISLVVSDNLFRTMHTT